MREEEEEEEEEKEEEEEEERACGDRDHCRVGLWGLSRAGAALSLSLLLLRSFSSRYLASLSAPQQSSLSSVSCGTAHRPLPAEIPLEHATAAKYGLIGMCLQTGCRTARKSGT